MTVVRAADATVFESHGSRFASYASTARGGTLCAWHLTVAPTLTGVAHRPSHEEVLLVLTGELRVTLDGRDSTVRAGDVVVVPAGSELQVDGGPEGATAWVTTTPGLSAVLADGTRMQPPWAQ